MTHWPSGLISSETRLTEAQMKELTAYWKEAFTGLETNAKLPVLPAGMTWKPITAPMERWYLDHERMYLGQRP
jgi:hypothetical protein